ncbi:MAG TPA: ATP-binding protein, partial [Candidatus Limnocylindrales bacterium]|nr:ATP-binding protein [Candidatus Limnocylindrales bacterium]
AMPDGVPSQLTAPDAAEAEALAAEGDLVRRVRWRLVAWSGLSTLVVLFVLGAALYLVAARTLEDQGLRQLDDRVAELRGIRPDIDEPGLGFRFGGGGSGTFAMVLDADGRAIGRRPPAIPTGLPIQASIDAAAVSARDVRLATVQDVPLRVLTERIDTTIGPIYVQVIADRRTERDTLAAILTVLLVGGAIVVVVALGFGAVYARRALVPIRESLTAQRGALRRQREFAADASHELRTPLTVIRASVDHLRRHRDEPVAAVGDALDDIEAETDHLTRLVEELLLLARSDSGAVNLEKLPVDVGDVAAEAAGSLAGPAGEHGVRIEVDPEPAVVTGDVARLRQLVLILVDNAIGHSPRDTTVRVAARRDGPSAVLTVEDEGAGLRSEDVPRLFERFWRGAGAPPGGAGLGLAIAAWIVSGHGGTIEAANRETGGARFTVRIPLAETRPV